MFVSGQAAVDEHGSGLDHVVKVTTLVTDMAAIDLSTATRYGAGGDERRWAAIASTSP